MSVINLYSNVWLYFHSGNVNDQTVLTKIMQTHGIDNEINFDNIIKHKTDAYTTDIQAELNRRDNIIKCWTALSKKIMNNVLNSSEPVIITSINHQYLIGFYFYFLRKTANITLDKSVKLLPTKINNVDYKLSDELKKILYHTCM